MKQIYRYNELAVGDGYYNTHDNKKCVTAKITDIITTLC